MRTWLVGLLVAGLLACGGGDDETDLGGTDRDVVLVDAGGDDDWGPLPQWDVPPNDAGPDCGETTGTAGLWQPCETNCDCAPEPGVFCYDEAYTAPHKMCVIDKTQAADCPPDPNAPGLASKYLNFVNSYLAKYDLKHKAVCFPSCAKDEDCTRINPALTYCPAISQTYWDEATVAGVKTCQTENRSAY